MKFHLEAWIYDLWDTVDIKTFCKRLLTTISNFIHVSLHKFRVHILWQSINYFFWIKFISILMKVKFLKSMKVDFCFFFRKIFCTLWSKCKQILSFCQERTERCTTTTQLKVEWLLLLKIPKKSARMAEIFSRKSSS